MNHISIILMSIFLTSFSVSCKSTSPPHSSILVGDQLYDVKDTKSAINAALSQTPEADNIIIFVHGRGDHPNKAINLIPKLISDYSASVIAFHWGPSSNGPLSFPDEEAKSAGGNFKKFLGNFSKIRDSDSRLHTYKITLLTHSMGAYVLEGMVNSSGERPKTEFIDTIVINAAAVPAKEHNLWLSKISQPKRIFVTVNRNDPILSLAAKMRGARLGQKLKTVFDKELPLVKNVTYLDVTGTKAKHRYYIKSGQPSDRLKNIFSTLLNGKIPDLSDLPIRQNQIYEL